MRARLISFCILQVILGLLLFGCSEQVKAPAEDIINNIINSDSHIQDYYGEAHLTVRENGKLISDINWKEYMTDTDKKVITNDSVTGEELILLKSGQNLTLYNSKEKEASQLNLSDDEMHLFGDIDPKDQFRQLIELTRDSHSYEILNEDKILGYDTYHMLLKAKDERNLIGDMHIWVDQKTWLVLKVESKTLESEINVVYTKLDFSPKFKKDTFTLKLPKGIQVKNLDEILDSDESDTTIEEAEEILGQKPLTISDQSLKATDFVKGDLRALLDRFEFEITYRDKNNHPQYSVTMFNTPEDEPLDNDMVRILKAGNRTVFFLPELDLFSFDENGIRYNIMPEYGNYKEDEMIRLIEKMK